jgi:aryl-alcohol dehydrogenase-like predicted oxidoreductase
MADITATRVGTVPLGSSGLQVSALGLGCMVMSGLYAPTDPAAHRATFDLALDLGIHFFDTANSYGPDGHNETLVGNGIRGRRDRITLATKFGLGMRDGEVVADCRPETVQRCIDQSLRRLGTDHVDLYYAHRVDPDVPVEETVGAMADLVRVGKVCYLGLSEASAEHLRRAHAVHPISALQSEWSLWARQIESGVLPVARELGVGIVPYGPLGRGFLTGTITKQSDLDASDLRAADPRMSAGNIEHNLTLIATLTRVAERVGGSPAQVALAWLKSQGDDVIPIPGTERPDYLLQNAQALTLHLDGQSLHELGEAFPPGAALGDAGHELVRDLKSKYPASATRPTGAAPA